MSVSCEPLVGHFGMGVLHLGLDHLLICHRPPSCCFGWQKPVMKVVVMPVEWLPCVTLDSWRLRCCASQETGIEWADSKGRPAFDFVFRSCLGVGLLLWHIENPQFFFFQWTYGKFRAFCTYLWIVTKYFLNQTSNWVMPFSKCHGISQLKQGFILQHILSQYDYPWPLLSYCFIMPSYFQNIPSPF